MRRMILEVGGLLLVGLLTAAAARHVEPNQPHYLRGKLTIGGKVVKTFYYPFPNRQFCHDYALVVKKINKLSWTPKCKKEGK